jgi:hypothetical protein
MSVNTYFKRVSEFVEDYGLGDGGCAEWRDIINVVRDMGLSVSYLGFNMYAVFKPDEHFIRGVIGWGDYFDHSESDEPNRFMVGARHIRNGRYKGRSKQHTMRLSKNLDVAAKAARTYLTPVSVQEITDSYVGSIQAAHNDMMNDKTSKRAKATTEFLHHGDYELRNSPKLMDELLNLVNSDYVFKDAEIKASIKEWAEHHKDIKSMEGKQHTMRLIVMEHGKIKVTTPFDPMHRTSILVDFTEYPVKEALPVEILSKLAVLFVVEEGRFTPDVGVRLNDEVLCVY